MSATLESLILALGEKKLIALARLGAAQPSAKVTEAERALLVRGKR